MSWDFKITIFSIFLFVASGILEVGGGYLMWLGIRENKWPYLFIPAGALVLSTYGVIPTFQPSSSFGRIFAVYGGFFIVLSYLWAYVFDNFKPDLGDYIGSSIAIIGVCVAWFWPR
ncbi:YnfA family protein [archaeon]|nr:MAG: YnfA family protein [archaeon]